jgi:hypothetical protein
VGAFGGGVRLNFPLRDALTNHRVPYLAAGFSVLAWFPMIDGPRTIASVEVGLQAWPRNARRLYVDDGVGAGLVLGSSSDPVPVVRIVAGQTF